MGWQWLARLGAEIFVLVPFKGSSTRSLVGLGFSFAYLRTSRCENGNKNQKTLNERGKAELFDLEE